MIATRGQSRCPKFLCTVCTFVSQEKLICGRILLAGETSEDIIDKSMYTFFFLFTKIFVRYYYISRRAREMK